MQKFFTIVLAIISTCAYSQNSTESPSNYYDGTDGLTCSGLKTKLFQIINTGFITSYFINSLRFELAWFLILVCTITTNLIWIYIYTCFKVQYKPFNKNNLIHQIYKLTKQNDNKLLKSNKVKIHSIL